MRLVYKLVLFDLGGVVFTNGTKKFISDISSRYGIEEVAAKNVFDGEIGTKYREAQITRDEFWKQVLESLPLKESADELENEWIEDYDLISGTKEILDKLRDKYKVMYLSDNVKERVDKLDKKYGFTSWFDDGIFSHDVGVRKPNPKIYEYALQKGQADPKKTVFIDDKPEMLEPAKEMGITGLAFESPKKLEKDLKEIGIL